MGRNANSVSGGKDTSAASRDVDGLSNGAVMNTARSLRRRSSSSTASCSGSGPRRRGSRCRARSSPPSPRFARRCGSRGCAARCARSRSLVPSFRARREPTCGRETGDGSRAKGVRRFGARGCQFPRTRVQCSRPVCGTQGVLRAGGRARKDLPRVCRRDRAEDRGTTTQLWGQSQS